MRWLVRLFVARFAARLVREVLARFSQSAARGQAAAGYRESSYRR